MSDNNKAWLVSTLPFASQICKYFTKAKALSSIVTWIRGQKPCAIQASGADQRSLNGAFEWQWHLLDCRCRLAQALTYKAGYTATYMIQKIGWSWEQILYFSVLKYSGSIRLILSNEFAFELNTFPMGAEFRVLVTAAAIATLLCNESVSLLGQSQRTTGTRLGASDLRRIVSHWIG